MKKVFLLICFPFALNAKDLGTQGHLFEIQEENLVTVIGRKLQVLESTGKLKGYQKAFQEKAKQKMSVPSPVEGIRHTTTPRSWLYDPSFRVKQDLRDLEGRIFAHKGDVINPLKHVRLPKPLLFIDGDDDKQVQWALRTRGKVILVCGKPIQLTDQHKIPFYFDQGGVLTQKLGIRQVPAKVTQKELQLHIEEVLCAS